MINKLRGQILKQLGVRWLVTHDPEVVGRVHNARAEVPFPDAVHNDASSNWMIGDIFGKLETAAAIRIRLLVRRAQHRKKASLNHGPRRMRVAAEVEVHVDGFGLVSLTVDVGVGCVFELFIKLVNLLLLGRNVVLKGRTETARKRPAGKYKHARLEVLFLIARLRDEDVGVELCLIERKRLELELASGTELIERVEFARIGIDH